MIGVVRDANHYDARKGSKMVYLPGDREGSFLVRGEGDQVQTFSTIRGAVAASGAPAEIEKLSASVSKEGC